MGTLIGILPFRELLCHFLPERVRFHSHGDQLAIRFEQSIVRFQKLSDDSSVRLFVLVLHRLQFLSHCSVSGA